MNEKELAVKIEAPKVGPWRFEMRFVGQAEVAAFLRDYPAESERLQAWVVEMKYRNWRDAQDLTAVFRDVDVSRPPLTVFRFVKPPIHIETLIDFRTNVLVLLAIKHPQRYLEHLQNGNERHDH